MVPADSLPVAHGAEGGRALLTPPGLMVRPSLFRSTVPGLIVLLVIPGSVPVPPVLRPPMSGVIDWWEPVIPLPELMPEGLVVWAKAADEIEATRNEAAMSDLNILNSSAVLGLTTDRRESSFTTR